MDTTFTLAQNVNLIETLSDEMKAMLAEAGMSITELQRLLDPKERVIALGWA